MRGLPVRLFGLTIRSVCWNSDFFIPILIQKWKAQGLEVWGRGRELSCIDYVF